jgi:excisionase family DNA binding protein
MMLLSATEAAERLGIHPSLVRFYLRDGRLKAARQRPWMISEEELERFAEQMRPLGRPKARRT